MGYLHFMKQRRYRVYRTKLATMKSILGRLAWLPLEVWDIAIWLIWSLPL